MAWLAPNEKRPLQPSGQLPPRCGGSEGRDPRLKPKPHAFLLPLAGEGAEGGRGRSWLGWHRTKGAPFSPPGSFPRNAGEAKAVAHVLSRTPTPSFPRLRGKVPKADGALLLGWHRTKSAPSALRAASPAMRGKRKAETSHSTLAFRARATFWRQCGTTVAGCGVPLVTVLRTSARLRCGANCTIQSRV